MAAARIEGRSTRQRLALSLAVLALLGGGLAWVASAAQWPTGQGCLYARVPAEIARQYPVVGTPDTWRFGAGVSADVDPDVWLPRLGAGWYLDWNVRERPKCAYPEHWQVVRVHPATTTPPLDVVQQIARRYPGQVWIIGNEPDAPLQDNLLAERYAAAYHDLYSAIKQADATAQIAAGSIVQATPLRLRYLDRVLEAYAAQSGGLMPVDVWVIHGYVLNEQRGEWGAGIPPGLPDSAGAVRSVEKHGDSTLFEAQIIAFRRWMAERGYRDRPLVVSEYGILLPERFGYPPERVADFMRASFDFLRTATDPALGQPADGNRLVQRWAWFSLADVTYPAGNLIDATSNAPTALGLAYRDYLSLITAGSP